MNYALLFLLMVVNTGISIWNAYAVGAYLTETKVIGGWPRLIVWCGLVMSACGFSWVYLVIATLIAVSGGWLTLQQGKILFDLGYIALIIPILGSGLGIWVHSVMVAVRRRKFGDVAVAAWNTFAQAHNTWEAASYAPSAFKEVVEFMKSDDADEAKGKAIALVIGLCILVLFLGALTTALIARWADRRVAIDVTFADFV